MPTLVKCNRSCDSHDMWTAHGHNSLLYAAGGIHESVEAQQIKTERCMLRLTNCDAVIEVPLN